MQLSVIIVNYKVKHFLDQCLQSLFAATKTIDTEVFVVDNHSQDGSIAMVKSKYPSVKLIENQENLGFSRANNQALRQAQGDYLLLLNPDTLIQEDTLEKCVQFMNQHGDTGALGVKMINGKGEFLPESKRGLPLPGVAFYKIFGFSKFFPKSKKFGAYHLTYLDDNETHAVDILSGAFMMIRKTVLDQIGYLDEDYFMYGEDIDLSYRIIKAGYKNYYYPETQIIHYKGESTKKNSVNWVFVFYRAMQIFAQKQFSHQNAKTFSRLITLAIWFRAFLALLKRFLKIVALPLLDFAVIYGGILGLANYWEIHVLHPENSHFPSAFLYIVIPFYILFWIVGMVLCSGYKKPVSLARINRGIIFGSIVILLIYALLPEWFRFSRAIIIFGSMWTLIAVNAIRYVLSFMGLKSCKLGGSKQRTVVVGLFDEALRVAEMMRMIDNRRQSLHIILTEKQEKNVSEDSLIIGNIAQIKKIIELYSINEVIFCARNLSAQTIIEQMRLLQPLQPEFKIAHSAGQIIIGSSTIKTWNELFLNSENSLFSQKKRIQKRIFDLLSTLLLCVFVPFYIIFITKKAVFFQNLFSVCAGKKTWIGYISHPNIANLPKLRANIIPIADVDPEMDAIAICQINRSYAENYNWRKDLKRLWTRKK